MELLALSLAALVGSHIVPSSPSVRRRLLSRLGRKGFHALYSLVSLAALTGVILAYRATDTGPWLWIPPPEARYPAILLMPVAIFLVVCRLTTRPDPAEARGIYRVTCVPGSLGVLIWTLLHLANVGTARIILVFASMALIALFALVKNVRLASPAQRRAGVIPFAAILMGRQRLAWNEIGWLRLCLGLAAYLSILLLHPHVIGLDPLAGVR